MTEQQWILEGQFSWNKPIEQIMLDYAKHMLGGWQRQENRFGGFFGDSKMEGKVAGNIMAYRTMIEFLDKEIEFRKSVKETK